MLIESQILYDDFVHTKERKLNKWPNDFIQII